VLWDYHVILLARFGEAWCVVDPDSRLPQPTRVIAYLDASFPRQQEIAPIHRPHFRLVAAAELRRSLRTDRSHMRRGDGFAQPQPPWPCIGTGTNLMQFVDMQRAFLGEVVDLQGLRAWIAARTPEPARER